MSRFFAIGAVLLLAFASAEATSVMDFAYANNHTFFAGALDAVGFGEMLGDKNFKGTVFIPIDAAFTPADLAADPSFILAVSKYHLIRGEALQKKFLGMVQSKNTLLTGQSVTIVKPRGTAARIYFGKMTYNDADLSFGGFARVLSEHKVGKAVVYVIDRVLVPPM